MLTISELFIYPVKSLAGISVNNTSLTDRGFQYDRRWMLVDDNNKFISQREIPEMALLQVQLADDQISVKDKNMGKSLLFPIIPETDETAVAQIWDDRCQVQFVSEAADKWFSEILSVSCRLVYMPDATERMIDKKYTGKNELTSLADDCAVLMIGQASLDDLNTRLPEKISMNRFRPNIVFTGGQPFEEDSFKSFTINRTRFHSIKRCARCLLTTISQEDASRSKEPLKTLAIYRTESNKTFFGKYFSSDGKGVIKVGDVLQTRNGE